MINGDVNEFVNCITYEDCVVRYNGYRYWFNGIDYYEVSGKYSTLITKYEDEIEFKLVDDVLDYESTNRDEVMYHILNDKIFDGKSFYEAESKMEWIDW